MRKHNFKVRLLSLIALCGIVMMFTACSNEDVAQGSVETNTANNDNLTTFVTGNPATRTSLNYDDGAFFWETISMCRMTMEHGTRVAMLQRRRQPASSSKCLVSTLIIPLIRCITLANKAVTIT